jgi:outer membrane protein OmpA-like peptidoglycan-associated protein
MSRPSHRPATAIALVLGLFAPLPATAQSSLSSCGPGSGLPCVDEISGATMETAEALRELYEARDQDTGFIDGMVDEPEAGVGDTVSAGELSADAAANAEPEPSANAPAQAETGRPADAGPPAHANRPADAGPPEDRTQAAPERTPRAGELPDCGPGAGFPCVDRMSGAVIEEPENLRELYEARDQDTSFLDDMLADSDAEREAEERARQEAEETQRLIEEAERRAAEAEREAEEQRRQAEDAARRAQERAKAGPPAAALEDAEPAEVERREITEAEARASSEEFETEIQTDAEAAATEDDDDGDRLRDLGRAALIGLGAYALGQVLDDGGEVVAGTGERVVVERDGRYDILKDDDTLLRRPGADVQTERFADGSVRTRVILPEGGEVITIRAADGRILRRVRVMPDGQRVVLFDDTRQVQPVDISQLPRAAAPVEIEDGTTDEDELAEALRQARLRDVNRSFSLEQIRQIDAVRKLVPVVSLDRITFPFGSAAIPASEAEELNALGTAMRRAIRENPGAVFLVEGHTDAVGSAATNLLLSDRRAESVALALTEYFSVPPANMIVQGYGESDLRVETQDRSQANRRAAVRNITPLLTGRS